MTYSDFPLRLVKSYTKILKWNHNHYGAGEHGGQFESNDTYGEDDEADKYFPSKQSEPPKKYTTDSKDLHAVFRQFENDGCILNHPAEEMAKQWKQLLPNVHPHEFLRGFFGKDGATNTNVGQLQLQVNAKDKRISFAATGDDLEVHGDKVIDYQRVIDLASKNVEHSKLEVDESRQGSGIVKKLFKSVLPLYEKMGVENISLYANIDRGGYAWGKYGFHYYDDEERVKHQKGVKARLDKLMSPSLGIVLTPEATKEKEAIEKVLRGKKDETIWALTDMKTPHLDQLYAKLIKKDSKKSSFVKLLNKNTHWAGLMNIEKGSPARARLEKYIGTTK